MEQANHKHAAKSTDDERENHGRKEKANEKLCQSSFRQSSGYFMKIA